MSWGKEVKKIPKRKWCPELDQECGGVLCGKYDKINKCCAIVSISTYMIHIWNQLRFKEPQK